MVCVIPVLFCYMNSNFILGFYLCNYNYDCKFGKFFFRSRYNNHHMLVHVLHSDSMRKKKLFFSRSRIVIHFCFSFTCLLFLFLWLLVLFPYACHESMPWHDIHVIHNLWHIFYFSFSLFNNLEFEILSLFFIPH